jgi:hypothetical protein
LPESAEKRHNPSATEKFRRGFSALSRSIGARPAHLPSKAFQPTILIEKSSFAPCKSKVFKKTAETSPQFYAKSPHLRSMPGAAIFLT